MPPKCPQCKNIISDHLKICSHCGFNLYIHKLETQLEMSNSAIEGWRKVVKNLQESEEAAWGIIVNAFGGDWTKAPENWRKAAEQWRDAYHATMPTLFDINIDSPEELGGYGYCPICKAPCLTRERRPNGDDTCVNGHKYPSRTALKKL